MTSNPHATIGILGGAGKAGRPLVQEALKAGYHLRLLLRHPEQFTIQDNRIEIIQGDAREAASLRQVLQGCQALVSTLGHPRGEHTPILSTVTRQLLPLMQESGINRYIVVTSLYTIGEELQDEKTRQAAAFMQQRYPQFMADRQTELQLLTDSEMDWTYVRLPCLMQEPATGTINVSLTHLPGQQITVEGLAHFLVEQISSRRYIRQAPFVANG
jgi:putative NADH-flavin reductase